jgi:hypothetical protein
VCKKPLVKRESEGRPQFALRQFCSIPCKHLGQFINRGVKKCPTCGKSFTPKCDGTVFCTKECRAIGVRINKSDKRCINCGVVISHRAPGKRTRSVNDYNARKFCSRGCAGEAKYKFIDKRCKYCGKNMFREDQIEAASFRRKQFCNRACIAKYRADKIYGASIVKECVYCGRDLVSKNPDEGKAKETPAALAVRKFCNSRCWGLWKEYTTQKRKRAVAAAKKLVKEQQDSARWDATVQAKRNSWKEKLRNDVLSVGQSLSE